MEVGIFKFPRLFPVVTSSFLSCTCIVILVKGAKTIAQLGPQQIVVIKQSEDGINSSDKKHTVLLKQLQNIQNQQRLTLAAAAAAANLQKSPRQSQQQQQQPSHQQLPADISGCSIIDSRVAELPIVSSTESVNSVNKQELFEKHQKQLQQILVKQQELKLQQQQASGTVTKEQTLQSITIQQPKSIPKQMIVIKQNQGQIVAETQSVVNEEDSNNTQGQKQHITSPLVILNKQQYQQQLQNQKHQIIQLTGQQVSPQQIRQLILKQQQTLKRTNQQQPQQSQQQQSQQQPQQTQQIVMLKPEIQQGQQQILMLKQQPQQQQQQLVMIKQSSPSGNQKIQQKQGQPQIIQIANSAGIVTPISTDLTKVRLQSMKELNRLTSVNSLFLYLGFTVASGGVFVFNGQNPNVTIFR